MISGVRQTDALTIGHYKVISRKRGLQLVPHLRNVANELRNVANELRYPNSLAKNDRVS